LKCSVAFSKIKAYPPHPALRLLKYHHSEKGWVPYGVPGQMQYPSSVFKKERIIFHKRTFGVMSSIARAVNSFLFYAFFLPGPERARAGAGGTRFSADM